MKNSWVTKGVDEFTGMRSSEPSDRVETDQAALLMNAHADRTGRIVKQRGVSMVALGTSFRMTASSGRLTPRSGHVYQGRNGISPSSRLLTVLSSNLFRSPENDLLSAHDIITFPANIDTPALNRAAAGVFRKRHFYHQNGVDIPFRVECETDDGTAPSLVAEILGLKPPAYCMNNSSTTVGQGKRFAPYVYTTYAITFVYGDRGESGPGPALSWYSSVTYDTLGFQYLPLGPSGCTARRIYRSQIGHGRAYEIGASAYVKRVENGPPVAMYLVDEIKDNTTTTWSDSFDDASLDYSTSVPPLRPFPPIAKYAAFHLDRIFWANGRQHPYVFGVMNDPTRVDHTITDYRITISNTGNGTITLESFYTAAWHTDITISDYKTHTLRYILEHINVNVLGAISGIFTNVGACAIPAQGIDLDRTYTFKAVTQQSIFGGANVYWAVAIDDTATEGLEWFPSRCWFTEIAFPEQMDGFNNFDLTAEGSKKITACVHSELDGSLVLFTEDKPFIVSGDFVPSLDTGVPVFRIDPAIASTGNICYRPDAVAATDIGIFYVAHDGVRLFRGEISTPAGREVQDWFKRVLNEPITRDNLSMLYHAGILRICLPTYEIP